MIVLREPWNWIVGVVMFVTVLALGVWLCVLVGVRLSCAADDLVERLRARAERRIRARYDEEK